MNLQLLMIILDEHELCSSPTRMSLLKSSLYSLNEFKIRKALTLFLLEVIKGENLKMKTKSSMKNITLFIIFLVHNFSCPRTLKQNRVLERKNRSLQEIVITIWNDNNSPKYFWAKVVNTACYLQNRIYIIPILKKTPYELWKGKQPNTSYFHPFGYECFILNIKDNLGNFDPKFDKGTFLGYFNASKAYKVYNSRSLVEEFIHVKFNDFKPDKELLELNNSFADLNTSSKESYLDKEPKEDKLESTSTNWVRTRSSSKDQAQVALLFELEPKNIDEALMDDGSSLWTKASTLYEKLSSFFMKNVYHVQIYVDNIIFGAIDEYLCEEFFKMMQK
ncbi:hypothetical protein CR513_40877, partial [Mucuna pruriens]